MRILVTGGTGYVGRAVQRALRDHHHEVTILARHPTIVSPGVRPVAGDIRDADLTSLMAGVDTVVHLVGIIEEKPAQGVTFDAMHYEVTRRVVQAMMQSGCQQLIHVSALGTREDAHSHYHRSKWKAEQFIRNSQVKFMILRPSLLFGGGAPFFHMMKNQCRWPVVPVPGTGETLLQPVARIDVAELIAHLVDVSECRGETWEIGGPESLTLNALYRRVAAVNGRDQLPLFHIPLGILLTTARLGQNVPGFPVTVDQLLMLNEPNVTHDTRWHQFIPHPAPLGHDL